MESNIKKRLLRVGENLKKARTVKHLSLRDLSYLCTIDNSDISKMEQGQINISLETLFELSDALEIDPRELLKFD